ncbi:putative oxidoreductase CipA [Hyaloscypha finlandica]|nr:putative oxidoreductase CipA [Hyaloscypha finlandica]
MAQKYAKDQPAGFTNFIERIAIVGIGGRIGSHIAEELVKTGKHKVTALVRGESNATVPKSIHAAAINYEDETSIVSALRGQQFLIITLAVTAPPDTQSKLLKAAAQAGVPYVMPNVYGGDILNNSLQAEGMYDSRPKIAEIESLGLSWVVLVCGFWYEWSLALGPFWFGFDFANKKVTFFDDGKTPINVSTWPQCGRAVAGLLSLKELPEDENDKSPTVSRWKNKPLYITSFKSSQRDMLDSVHRLTGSSDKDWEIEYEPSLDRYEHGKAEMQKGMRTGFAKAMYARVFYPNGDGDFESSRGLDNELVGLQKEEIDEITRGALDMVESGWNPFAQGFPQTAHR